MDDLSATPSLAPRRAYRKAGPQTWALIRELYLSGVPAAELAVRFDVSVHTVRKRATREGWSRKAQAEAVTDLRMPRGADRRWPPASDVQDGVAGEGEGAADPCAEAEPLEAVRTLLRRASGAAVAGRLAEAGTAVKLAEGMARAAAALGLGGRLDPKDGEAWGEGEAAPSLSPHALDALRDEVERRYARFDRPAAEGVRAGTGAVAVEADAPGGVEDAVAAEAAAGVEAGSGQEARTPVSTPGRPWPEEESARGISRPPRSISAAPWPAWAGPPHAPASRAWRS